jgi:alkylation response protein AidB-like acyl-CoA dehydrogenase
MGKKEDKLGIRASQTAELVLDDVRVPMDNLLGGLDRLERRLGAARSGESLALVGALATFEVTRRWSARARSASRAPPTSGPRPPRRARGPTSTAPLLEQQRVQQVLADVATEIDAARLLVQRATWMGRNGVPMTGGQGSMSKLKAGDVAMWATTALMDLVGPRRRSPTTRSRSGSATRRSTSCSRARPRCSGS